MRLRPSRLSATLLLMVTAVSGIQAAEIAKGLSLDGYSDTILTYTNEPHQPGGPSLAGQQTDLVDFSSMAKLKVGWHPNERIAGQVSVLFGNDSTNQATLSESWMSVQVTSDLSWTMGRYLNHQGWIGPEPMALYRVQSSTIGYADIYGNDPLGTYLDWAPKDGPLAIQFHVTNGWFDPKDTANDTSVDRSATDHRRSDLGLGLNFTITPCQEVHLELEAAWDPSSSQPEASLTGKLPSDIVQLGLHTTVNGGDAWTFAGEVIHRWSVNGAVDEYGTATTRHDLNWLLVVNRKLPASFPSGSLTGMFQQVHSQWDNARPAPAISEFSAALLTNPLDTDRLGVNVEVAYVRVEGDRAATPNGTTTISLEALVVLP